MRTGLVGSALLLTWALAAPLAHARTLPPDEALKLATQDVLFIIRQDKAIQWGNPAKVAERVESRILPHFDFNRMAQIAAGRHWRLATPAQQQALITEFKTIVVQVYATALSVYRDRAIEFKPLRAAPGDTQVTVKSIVKQSGGAPLTMDYEMENAAGAWKVYDIRIEGVSLITNYRETFTGKIRDSGVDGLIKSLAEKNRQGENRMRAQQDESFYPSVFIRTLLQGLGNRRVGVAAGPP